jgi:hypothetical protein
MKCTKTDLIGVVTNVKRSMDPRVTYEYTVTMLPLAHPPVQFRLYHRSESSVPKLGERCNVALMREEEGD